MDRSRTAADLFRDLISSKRRPCLSKKLNHGSLLSRQLCGSQQVVEIFGECVVGHLTRAGLFFYSGRDGCFQCLPPAADVTLSDPLCQIEQMLRHDRLAVDQPHDLFQFSVRRCEF